MGEVCGGLRGGFEHVGDAVPPLDDRGGGWLGLKIEGGDDAERVCGAAEGLVAVSMSVPRRVFEGMKLT